MATTFSPTDKSTYFLIVGGLTVGNQFGVDATGRTIDSASTGKIYWEAQTTAGTGTGAYQRGISFGNASASLSQGQGSPDTNSGCVFQGDSQLYIANVATGPVFNYSAGAHISVALDLDNNLVWYRLNGGNWNNNASYNPDTAVGGRSITSVAKPIFGMHWSTGNTGGDGTTVYNFGDSAFTYTPPTLFVDRLGAGAAAGGALPVRNLRVSQAVRRASYW